MHLRVRMATLALLGALLFWMVGTAPAQSGEAEVAGIVADSSGAVIGGVQVTLTNQDTGITHSTTTQSDGQYRFVPVPPGRYNIAVKAPSFASENVTGLVVDLGMHVTQNVTLKPGNTQEVVTVSGEVPVVDTSSNDVSGVINDVQMNTLPINTRQYLNLALLMPGTTQDASRTFYNNVQLGAGGTYYANGFMVDGVKNTWAEMGEPRENFPEGAVQEFKVYVTQFPADYGLAMGGLVTVATKGGTNLWHGELFEYFRNRALNADNKFQQQAEQQQHTGKPPFMRNQFGFDFGGPIIKDRTHFYASYERTQTDDSYTIFTQSPQFYGGNQGTFDKPTYDQMITGRVDHQISNKQQVFVRYGQEWNKLTYQGCGGNSMISCYDGLIPRHSLVAGHTWTPTNSIVNDFRFQYAYASYELGPSGFPIYTDPTHFSAAALAELQTAYIFPSFNAGFNYAEVGVEKRTEFNDTLSWTHGKHNLRFGGDVSYVPFSDSFAYNLTGTFIFPTDQVFNIKDPATIANLTNPSLYLASIPSVYTSVPTTELGFFAQDDWKVRPNVTINLGLRYDRELGAFNESLNLKSFPQTIPFLGNPSKRGDSNNFAPRVGVAWDMLGNGRDVVRGGYGIYYNNIQTLQNFSERQNLAQCNIVISNPSYPDPFQGQSPSSFCSTAPPNVTVLAPNFANPYSQQANIGYSHQFSSSLALQVDGVYTHTLRDFRIVDLNYPDANGIRPLPAWGEILQHASIAQANYKALYVRADKRMSHNTMFTVSYTLASARDDNPQQQVTDQSNWGLDWGPSSIDRRHSLVASASFLLPWKLTLGAIWTVRSSLPFSAMSTTYNADGVQQYAPGTTRDQGNRDLKPSAFGVTKFDSSRYNDFDIRLSRSFFVKEQRRLEVIGQVFNLFGTTNLLGTPGNVVTNAESPSFGTITAASNVQQAELAVRFTF